MMATARQKAAAARNLVKARAAKKRGGKATVTMTPRTTWKQKYGKAWPRRPELEVWHSSFKPQTSAAIIKARTKASRTIKPRLRIHPATGTTSIRGGVK